MANDDHALFEQIRAALGSSKEQAEVAFTGPSDLLPSPFRVGALATASIGAATAAIAELHAARTGRHAPNVTVDRAHAAVAFRSERYVTPIGWELPPIWDPIAGDYPTKDGWIRLHTNYAYHRDAVLRVLGVKAEREVVARAVLAWSGDALESAVVEERGCAARMRSRAEWAFHPQGQAVANEPLFAVRTFDERAPRFGEGGAKPLQGIRVLDLTRVIAGPICTRVLAAYGAEVLRIDPPGFEEVGALLPETTAGKRRAFLDLRTDRDRARLLELAASAHVIVHGYRSDALDRLGIDTERLRALNPSLIDIAHDAYGWTGPWSKRRGFDSLVQMSAGISERGRELKKTDRPTPLPAQALDHACGYLLAAATARSLSRLVSDGVASDVRLSLARVAKLLVDAGDEGAFVGKELEEETVEAYRETVKSAFGNVRRVRCPGTIAGIAASWTIPPGPLGSDDPSWRTFRSTSDAAVMV